MRALGEVLVIGCGALAREIVALRRANGWTALDVRCLPAELHNRPERIAPAVHAEIRANRGRYRTIFVAYGDCGTGGRLDAVLNEENVERLPGAHCYEFFAGAQTFAALAEAEPGTFYLTDFLLKNFDRLVTRGLGLDRHPELASEYFRHYRKLVYLAQTRAADADERARRIAQDMGLTYELRYSGYGELGTRLRALLAREERPAWQH
ncbi:MAG TPA: DUF1638 domain-containing protein [Steroidobacteraceae bacterium]|jgi:hypothetical protein|nr:DUF1638 domain-containing protein [Steroidobacteraceae bacterium]